MGEEREREREGWGKGKSASPIPNSWIRHESHIVQVEMIGDRMLYRYVGVIYCCAALTGILSSTV